MPSPRMAQPVTSPAASARSSFSIDRSASAAAAAGGRRNRSALRDFYNLQSGAHDVPGSASTHNDEFADVNPKQSTLKLGSASEDADLDRSDFHPQSHIDEVLRHAKLGDVLRTESRLLSDIRGLDGEKKALVYDNYSKLIRATDTIGHMKGEMDKEGVGLEGVGVRLEALVGDIVQKAGNVAGGAAPSQISQGFRVWADQRHTVQWLLEAPDRLRDMVGGQREQDLEAEWRAIQRRLDLWHHVRGVEEIRAECQEIVSSEGLTV